MRSLDSTGPAREYYFGPAWPYCCLKCGVRLDDPCGLWCDYCKEWVKDLCMIEATGRPVPAQMLVLRFILEYSRKTGTAPSLEDIGNELGFSRQAAHYHVAALSKKGWLTPLRGRARAIGVTPNGRRAALKPDAPESRPPAPGTTGA